MAEKKARSQWKEGALYTTDGQDVWRLDKYVPEPQLTMESLEVVVSGEPAVVREGLESEFSSFVRLIPEVEPPNRPKRKYERKQPAGVNSGAIIDQGT